MAGEVTTAWVDGRSVITRALATSPLRLVLNKNRAPSAWVVTSTLGGGLVDGDRITLEARALGGSALAVLTQASTKVYRGQSAQRTLGHVEDGALLAVLPDPVACFAGSRFEQETRVRLDDGGSTLILDKPLDRETLVAHISSRLNRIPRYRELAAFDSLNVAHPRWEHDPQFDAGRHIEEVTLSPGATEADLLDAIAKGARAAVIGSARERDRALPRGAASAERGLDRVRLNTA